MRVLFLRRQRFGGIATFTQALVSALDSHGIEVVVDDADDWIPNQTGKRIDREVSGKVRSAKKGFDLVHAFGYRAAWACAEAFGREEWVYTAHDMPKTTHPELVQRLNLARAGLCSSESVKREFELAGAKRLKLVSPGLPTDRRVMDKQECRAMLGAEPETFLIVSAGRFCTEHSLETGIHVVNALPHFARLVISGQGELESELRAVPSERTTIKTEPFSQQVAIAAADLVLVPSTVAGFSFTALEAMLQTTPVVVRRTGGLGEMVSDHQNGFLFDSDEELLDVLNHLCFKREMLAEVGRAGQTRAMALFDAKQTALLYAETYRAIFG